MGLGLTAGSILLNCFVPAKGSHQVARLPRQCFFSKSILSTVFCPFSHFRHIYCHK